ncbi:hypothetical protein CICLE_v10027278mg [Citrus x clementina]|uniref:Uncharacterized protein n=1 Tax=Citrus clementina TaxID=85681 RepID=V4RV37_CITCL|nr:hypothetical protein CICLE_v10027278mg [Citrus x clementina]GAY53830.1 hypothetical protein CUMW_152040 [Citrus unshiu]
MEKELLWGQPTQVFHIILCFRNGIVDSFHCFCISNCISNSNTKSILQKPIVNKPLCMSQELASSIWTNFLPVCMRPK